MLCPVLALKRGQLVQIVDMYPIEHQPGERWRKRRREKSGVRGRVSGGERRKRKGVRRNERGVRRREMSMRKVRRTQRI